MSDTATKQPAKKFSSKGNIVQAGGKLGAQKGGGVVGYCVQGPSAKITYSSSTLVEMLRVGLPVKELNDLQAKLDVPMEKLVPMLGISKSTLHRRKAAGRLDQAESDRVVRFAKLMGKAVEVFESEAGARQWLNSPQFGLGGAVPLQYAETEVGAREVENLLGRIEYGVYA